MPTEASRRAARTAIHEEIQRIMRDELSVELKQEIWRIQKWAIPEDDGESLRRIHDEALDLRQAVVPAETRATLDLIMSIARYEMDVRPIDRINKRP